jgi:hypothetical protein
MAKLEMGIEHSQHCCYHFAGRPKLQPRGTEALSASRYLPKAPFARNWGVTGRFTSDAYGTAPPLSLLSAARLTSVEVASRHEDKKRS